MQHWATAEHRRNRQHPFYRSVSHAEPGLHVTPQANLTHPDRSTNEKPVQLLYNGAKYIFCRNNYFYDGLETNKQWHEKCFGSHKKIFLTNIS